MVWGEGEVRVWMGKWTKIGLGELRWDCSTYLLDGALRKEVLRSV